MWVVGFDVFDALSGDLARIRFQFREKFSGVVTFSSTRMIHEWDDVTFNLGTVFFECFDHRFAIDSVFTEQRSQSACGILIVEPSQEFRDGFLVGVCGFHGVRKIFAGFFVPPFQQHSLGITTVADLTLVGQDRDRFVGGRLL